MKTDKEKSNIDNYGCCIHDKQHSGLHNCDGCCGKFPKPKRRKWGDEVEEESLSDKIDEMSILVGDGFISIEAIRTKDVKEFIRKCEKKPKDFDYKVINQNWEDKDAWGEKIDYPKKYSWKDIEYAIKLKVEQMKELAGGSLV